MIAWAPPPDEAHIRSHLETILGRLMDPKPRGFVLDGHLFSLPLVPSAHTHQAPTGASGPPSSAPLGPNAGDPNSPVGWD